jgi:hypothetical protein
MNVAVQIDPETGRVADVGLARRYLEGFLERDAVKVHIYWGKAEDFLGELGEKYRAYRDGK